LSMQDIVRQVQSSQKSMLGVAEIARQAQEAQRQALTIGVFKPPILKKDDKIKKNRKNDKEEKSDLKKQDKRNITNASRR
jgi:hypothetical protein